jgi:hypothetical protein
MGLLDRLRQSVAGNSQAVNFNTDRIKKEIKYIGHLDADSIDLKRYNLTKAKRFYSIFKDYYAQEERWLRATSSSVPLLTTILNLHKIMISVLDNLRKNASEQLGELDELYNGYAALVEERKCEADFNALLASQYRTLSSLYGHRRFKNTTQEIREKIEVVKVTMINNIDKVIERGEILDAMLHKSQALEANAHDFHQNARKLASQEKKQVVTRSCLLASFGAGSFFAGIGSLGVSGYSFYQAMLAKGMLDALGDSTIVVMLGAAGVTATLVGASLLGYVGKTTLDNCRQTCGNRLGYLAIK